MQSKSREAALCGMLSALAVVLLLLGGLIPVATYCSPLLVMLVLLPVRLEFGTGTALAAYGAVSILGLLLVPDKELALVYLFLGYYPALKPALDRLPSGLLRIVCKLALFNLSVFLMYGLFIRVFLPDSSGAEVLGYSRSFLLLLLGLANPVFLLMDVALGRFAVLWRNKLRRKFYKNP